MRKVFIISMFWVLLASWLKPYLPYIDYAFNKKYIVKNLCENKDEPELECNGKCHLMKELEKAAEEPVGDNEPKRNAPQSAKAKINLISQTVETGFVFCACVEENEWFSSVDQSLKSIFRDIPTPPPKYS